MRDKIVEKLIRKEAARQKQTIDLIPSENFVSDDVMEALGSVFTNKYAEGYPHARYYGGNEVVDEVEELAKSRALRLFRLATNNWHVNVQPYSGSPANLAAILALVPPGETIMGLQLSMGGHLTHGHKVSATGRLWRSVQYDVDPKTERLNYDAILRLAKKEKPKLIIAGYTAYPRYIDWKAFRKIADAVGAYFMVDMSHIAGLIAGKVYPSPFPYADIVTTTTHKTLRGPRSAMIFANKESTLAKKNGVDIARAVDRAVFPGLQGGPHVNQVAAIAVAMKEADSPAYRKYAQQIVKNAKSLAYELERLGFRIISGGTDSHLLLVDVMAKGISGKEASTRLEKAGIICNMNTIPHDPRPPMDPSGIRLGTPAVTTRGMKEKDMQKIAKKIVKVLLQ
ncbi:MAG: Serine hydroxymethyltransferase [Candidatus Parcubacteria bacterium]|jgi:glycine hydroxymethyltransferase